jgi:hypothetical protein
VIEIWRKNDYVSAEGQCVVEVVLSAVILFLRMSVEKYKECAMVISEAGFHNTPTADGSDFNIKTIKAKMTTL